MADQVVNAGISLTAPFWFFEDQLVRCYVPLDPSEYGQCENKVCEVFRRVIVHSYGVPLIICAVPVALIGHVLMELGRCLGASEIQHLVGTLPEKAVEAPKILHLNTCMFPGSLSLHFGGMSPASSRVEALVEWIVDQDADIVMLSEVCDLIAGKLEEALSKYYAHFYSKIGVKPFGMGASLFVASRIPPKRMEFTEFAVRAEGIQKHMKRGFVKIELADMVLFFTHLHPDDAKEDEEMREAQFKEIKQAIEVVPGGKTVFLVGDLNTDYRQNNFLERHELTWISPVEGEDVEEGEFKDYILSGSGKVDDFVVSYLGTKGLSDHPGVLVAPC